MRWRTSGRSLRLQDLTAGIHRALRQLQGQDRLPPVTGGQKRTEKDGKVILVTAISPTPAGEGKTTTTVGLADALMKRIDKRCAGSSQRTFSRTGLRHQGRSRRRRLRTGGADGGHQPSLYRRYARYQAQPTICWRLCWTTISSREMNSG